MSIFSLFTYHRSSVAATAGVSLVELIIIMSIMVGLFVLTTASVTPLIPKAEIRSGVDVLLADLKTQQAKAMLGNTDGLSSPQPFGIYFQPTAYTLFSGNSYSVDNPTNTIISLSSSLEISTNLPDSAVIFNPGSGDVAGYTEDSDTITIQDSTTALQKQLQLNRYGTVVAIN